jgi:hypothetical protein
MERVALGPLHAGTTYRAADVSGLAWSAVCVSVRNNRKQQESHE